MGSLFELRTELRRLARASQDAGQSSRLLSLAAVHVSKADRPGLAERIAKPCWMHRFNEARPEGLKGAWRGGAELPLSPSQLAELSDSKPVLICCPWGGTLAARRFETRHKEALRGRLSCAPCVDASEDWLLPHGLAGCSAGCLPHP